MLRRRSLLAGLAAPLLAPPAAAAAAASGLNAEAQRRGLFYGAAIDTHVLHSDPAFMARVAAECGVVVGEYSFKWARLHPAETRFDFTDADALVAYAERHRLRVRGHALAWHESNPDWLIAGLRPDNAAALLSGHIATVVGHFRHRVAQWDVVNEAIEPDDGQPGGLRNSLWFKALGASYIDIAFHACEQADPGALRVLNDYGMDYALPWQQRRRDAMLELLSALRGRGVAVQALGLQAHLDGSETNLDQKRLADFIAAVAALGLRIVVTELDVRDNGLPADIDLRDCAIAAHARAFLDTVLANGAVDGVVTWGLSDRRSWLDTAMPRSDHLPQRPLPLDAELRRKPLYAAIAGAVAGAPRRG